MNYTDFISKFINKSNYFPIEGNIITGTNGLYGEKETSYRTLSHWAMLILDGSIEDNKVDNFLNLFLKEFEQHNLEQGPFKSRDSNVKDTSNGLIGTAWNVEGIMAVIELCKNRRLGDSNNSILALEKMLDTIYKHYKYNYNNSNWPNIIEPDGKVLGIDRTFNHQLWFAASKYKASEYLGKRELRDDVNNFIDNFPKNKKVNHVGTIYHTVGTYPHYHKTLLKRLISKNYRNDMVRKEYGYHAFNLLGFVRLLDSGCKDVLSIIIDNIKVTKTKKFRNNQDNNIYGSSYNPVGIELAVAISKIKYNDEDILYWLNYHFNQFFDTSSFSFTNSNDNATLNSRLYELVYLNDKTKDIIGYNKENNSWFFKNK